MGQGHTSAEDKISCMLHVLRFEARDVQQLLRGLDEFISFTTDLGTEVKTVYFFLDRANLSSVMPTWLATRVSRSPPQPDLSDDAPLEARYYNPLLQCEGDAFMKNGIPMPGAGHMIHNIIPVTYHTISFWDQDLNSTSIQVMSDKIYD